MRINNKPKLQTVMRLFQSNEIIRAKSQYFYYAGSLSFLKEGISAAADGCRIASLFLGKKIIKHNINFRICKLV